MAWFRIDDKSHMNAKVAAAGNAAWGLYTRCGAWSCDTLTDGYIPLHIARQYGTKSEIAKCASTTLWVYVDEGPHGLGPCYHMPDFLEFNKSRADALVERADAAERQRRARAAAKSKRDVDVTDMSQRDNPVSHGDVTGVSRSPRPDPTRPDPNAIESPNRQTLPAVSDGRSVVDQALDWYAQAVYDRAPEKCETTEDKYKRGTRRNALVEHRLTLNDILQAGGGLPELTAALGLTETEQIRYGIVEREDPIERAMRRNRLELERLGLNGAAS